LIYPPETSTLLSVMNQLELKNAADQLKQMLTPEQVAYSQAVSVCSVVMELGLQRASIEDVVDGLNERFQGMLERDFIQDVAEGAIEFGMQAGLMQYVDTETFSLSSTGMYVGRDWLKRLKQEF
jgi:hypothetical protein